MEFTDEPAPYYTASTSPKSETDEDDRVKRGAGSRDEVKLIERNGQLFATRMM